MEVFDQLNRRLTFIDRPKRIISLVPSLTELLCDLDLMDSIVGITKFCVHPDNLRREKRIVGGTKTIKIERIKTLMPDIIIANKEENTKEIIDSLSLIAPIHISNVSTVNDCLELIEMYGKIFLKQPESKLLCENLLRKYNDFKLFIKGKPPKRAAYFIWKNPWMVAASGTFINHLMQLNNLDNYFAKENRYPEINLNDIAKDKIDLILLSSEPFPFSDQQRSELQKLFPETKIELVDGEMFSWYGTRMLKAFDYFKTLDSVIR